MNNELRYGAATFGDDAIRAAQAAVDTSLNERTLDVDTMTATVKSAASLASFAQNEPVYFLRGGSQYALWYLKSVTRVAPKLWTLSMTSSLGRLAQMAHKGGVYNGVAASVIIADICGVVPYYVSSVFADTLLYGYLPYVSPSGENGAQTGSAKDNLLKVLFALNATVRDDAQGTLRVENLSNEISSIIGADRIYRDNALVTHETPITAVTVLEHQYIAGGELTTLFEGATVAGQVIVFREPMSDLAAMGFTITESGANYAVVSAGSGALTGRRYIHTTREITRAFTAAAIPNPARIEDATLVSVTNSADVANRLADYYAHRSYIECDATIDFEDAGDVVSIYDPFDKVMREACIEQISPLNVSRVLRGRLKALVGFKPWQVVPFEDVRVLLAGNDVWTVPGNVSANTEMQAVLIGKGLQGNAGEDGEDGASHHIIDSGSFTRSVSAKNGGAGGAGGEGGLGGNIYRISVLVNPGDTFSYNTLLDDSVFGAASSASGARSESGYIDPITGELCAAKGATGTAGGAGGAGGNDAGASGEAVEAWLGGAGGTYRAGSGGTTGSSGQYGGGGGGGAAVGNNGEDASTTGMDNGGGAGADAIPPAQAAGYGTGGTGGNGGGGGGGTGAAAVTARGNGAWYNPAAASGGKGSDGGEGAYGCIILYYRRPMTE